MKKFNLFLFIILFQLAGLAQQKTVAEIKEIVTRKTNISNKLLETLTIKSYYTDKQKGHSVIWFNQVLNGKSIFEGSLQLVLDAKGEFFKIQNKLIDFELALPIATALSFATIIDKNATSLKLNAGITKWIKSENGFDFYSIEGLKDDIKTQKIWWVNPVTKQLVSAIKTYIESPIQHHLFLLIFNENTGEIIVNKNLTLSCHIERVAQPAIAFENASLPASNLVSPEISSSQQTQSTEKYQVFAFPIESPIHGSQTIVENPANIEASPLGWLNDNPANFTNFTFTKGNNVLTYEDRQNMDFPGQFANQTGASEFLYPFDVLANPTANQNASITNLFYANNYIHDFAWFFGFDEVSGNFQTYNFVDSFGSDDAVRAEAFDGSGTNNANFGTPEDGFSPTMQMYLWYRNVGNLLTIFEPETLVGNYISALATFGPQDLPNPVLGDIVLYNDGSNQPSLACNSPLNSVFGKIALIDRGTCPFSNKVRNAQLAGAVGVIVVNNQNNSPFSMGGTGNNDDIFIPSIMISKTNGDLIKAALLSQTVKGSIQTGGSGDVFDSSFDNGVIAHEYGHGISNRLTGGPENVFCLFNEEQAGEGWSDFMALVTTTNSTNTANQARAIGNFVSGLSTTGSGIRPFPYSRNMAVNPVTYNYVSQLSVPHGVGSVWCSMIWDVYWDLVDQYGFNADFTNTTAGNNKAVKLVFDGMRLQTCEPGFVDSRDAILEADQLNNNGENFCLLWKAFARRGLGLSADQGSSDFVGDETSAFDVPSNCITAIDEVNQNNLHKQIVAVFPNPTQHSTQIVLNKNAAIEQLQLLDITGKICPTALIEYQKNNQIITVDLSSLSQGVYFLKLTNSYGAFSIKLVKQ